MNEQDLDKLMMNKRSFGYDVIGVGYRYHISNVHAEVGIELIMRKEYISKQRHDSLKLLREKLNDNSLIEGWVPYDKEMIPFMNVALFRPECRIS